MKTTATKLRTTVHCTAAFVVMFLAQRLWSGEFRVQDGATHVYGFFAELPGIWWFTILWVGFVLFVTVMVPPQAAKDWRDAAEVSFGVPAAVHSFYWLGLNRTLALGLLAGMAAWVVRLMRACPAGAAVERGESPSTQVMKPVEDLRRLGRCSVCDELAPELALVDQVCHACTRGRRRLQERAVSASAGEASAPASFTRVVNAPRSDIAEPRTRTVSGDEPAIDLAPLLIGAAAAEAASDIACAIATPVELFDDRRGREGFANSLSQVVVPSFDFTPSFDPSPSLSSDSSDRFEGGGGSFGGGGASDDW